MQRERRRAFLHPGFIIREETAIILNTVDYSLDGEHVIMGAQMPRKYVAEMIMDRISACRTYMGDAYTQEKPLEYYRKGKDSLWFIHPQTKKELEGLLRILNDYGEDTVIWYIKNVYLRKGRKRRRKLRGTISGKICYDNTNLKLKEKVLFHEKIRLFNCRCRSFRCSIRP